MRLLNVALTVGSVLLAAIVIEGVHSLARRDQLRRSFFSDVYSSLKKWAAPNQEHRKQSPAMIGGLAFLQSREELASLIPELKKIDAGIGNTDFAELKTEEASVNGKPPCGSLKPNLHKELIQIRSLIFNPEDPPVIFFDQKIQRSAKVDHFIQKYGFWRKLLTTNENGERTTLPLLSRDKKVLVAGDSVALGLGVSDNETLSSHLQKMDSSYQYINLGFSGGAADQNFCTLSEAEVRYKEKIEELIYVLCDNDLKHDSPSTVIQWLKNYQTRNKIKSVTIIRAPYVHSIPPLRKPSPQQSELESQVAQLEQEAKTAGFTYFDVTELALKKAEENGTIYASPSIYIDHVHLTSETLSQLAQQISQQSPSKAAPNVMSEAFGSM